MNIPEKKSFWPPADVLLGVYFTRNEPRDFSRSSLTILVQQKPSAPLPPPPPLPFFHPLSRVHDDDDALQE